MKAIIEHNTTEILQKIQHALIGIFFPGICTNLDLLVHTVIIFKSTQTYT